MSLRVWWQRGCIAVLNVHDRRFLGGTRLSHASKCMLKSLGPGSKRLLVWIADTFFHFGKALLVCLGDPLPSAKRYFPLFEACLLVYASRYSKLKIENPREHMRRNTRKS